METVNTQPKTSWHRWFRRTNVYIAEYILMLIFVGALLGVLCSLWYTLFGMASHDGGAGKSIAMQAAIMLGSLLVVCPAAYWLYARVTGQEMVEPNVTRSKARTVFLTIWIIGLVIALVSVLGSTASDVISSIFSLGDSSGVEVWVGSFIPGIFAAVTLGCGIAMVVKHVSRHFVLTNALIVAGLAFVMIIANGIMIAVRKDYTPEKSDDCTLSAYYQGDCSYSEYREQNSRDDDSRTYNNSIRLFDDN